ncbi:MAG: DUF3047 domain-containing protein [Desulfobacteraceae bacterium]|nr:MAG: DUF3047 domain-containing protein [Desulfobacteraceae bacterium]
MKRERLLFIITMAGLLLCSNPALAGEWIIGHFSQADPARGLPPEWEQLHFPNIDRHTHYSLIRDDQQIVLQAESNRAASGLIRRLRIDPSQFPILRWRWKIAHVLEKGDVRRKHGDDYAARIYVAFAFEPQKASWWQRMRHSGAGLLAGMELPGSALNYIWANRAPAGTIVSNPYAEETKMIVVQSGNELQGRWVDVQRNIVEDYRSAFGRMPPEITGIGLMTDTDNTQEETVAFYGDIVLQSPPEQP